MVRNYKNPPVIETLCEFRFTNHQKWDWALPDLFYKKVKDRFPQKRQQNVRELPLKAEGASSQEMGQMQFLSKDKRTMIQIGPGLLAINQSISPLFGMVRL